MQRYVKLHDSKEYDCSQASLFKKCKSAVSSGILTWCSTTLGLEKNKVEIVSQAFATKYSVTRGDGKGGREWQDRAIITTWNIYTFPTSLHSREVPLFDELMTNLVSYLIILIIIVKQMLFLLRMVLLTLVVLLVQIFMDIHNLMVWILH
jgi:hypothetical protein